MTKKLDAMITRTVEALVEVENDQFQAYLKMDHRTKAAKATKALSLHARLLWTSLETIWKKTRKELAVLVRNPDFAPIHDLILEVIAAKVAATQRRRVERAKEEARAFSLEERAHFKNLKQGHA